MDRTPFLNAWAPAVLVSCLDPSRRILNVVTGRVYEAQSSGGRAVALKKSHITKHVKYPMLRHEACALFILAGHPSIPSVYAWGRSQYFEYLAMDLLGIPLTAHAKDGKRLDLTNVLSLVDQMVRKVVIYSCISNPHPQLDALEHLHSHHITHRDIKPENFLFGLGERGKCIHLIDYGFSCYYRDPLSLAHHPLQRNQQFVGTVHYASWNAHHGLSMCK
jgi:serine/threonine protein kinase